MFLLLYTNNILEQNLQVSCDTTSHRKLKWYKPTNEMFLLLYTNNILEQNLQVSCDTTLHRKLKWYKPTNEMFFLSVQTIYKNKIYPTY